MRVAGLEYRLAVQFDLEIFVSYSINKDRELLSARAEPRMWAYAADVHQSLACLSTYKAGLFTYRPDGAILSMICGLVL